MKGKTVKLNSFIQTINIYQIHILNTRSIMMELFLYETIKVYLQNIRITKTLPDVKQGIII
jgi:hypothetical protein